MWPRTQIQRKVLVGELAQMGPFSCQWADLAGCQGTPWGMGWLLQSGSLSVWIRASPLCLDWFLLLSVCICTRKKHGWLESSSNKICSLLQDGYLGMQAASDWFRKGSTELRCWLESCSQNSTVSAQRSAHLLKVFYRVYIFLINVLEAACCLGQTRVLLGFVFQWVLTGQ